MDAFRTLFPHLAGHIGDAIEELDRAIEENEPRKPHPVRRIGAGFQISPYAEMDEAVKGLKRSVLEEFKKDFSRIRRIFVKR